MTPGWISSISQEVAAGIAVALILALIGISWRWSSRRAARIIRQPTVIFVSTGSTCRDPMAKAIADQLFAKSDLHPKILACGTSHATAAHASKAAAAVISEIYGQDLLALHKPTQLTKTMADGATLILCMTASHRRDVIKTYPAAASKTHVLKPYFGEQGDIEDPWVSLDDVSSETLQRYRACAEELRDVLTRNFDHLKLALST